MQEKIRGLPEMTDQKPMRLFGSSSEAILAECYECGRVLRVRIAEATKIERGYSVASGISCPCGSASTLVLEDAPQVSAKPASSSAIESEIRPIKPLLIKVALFGGLMMLVVVGINEVFFNSGSPDKGAPTAAPKSNAISLPSGKFDDDVDAIDSNLDVYEKDVRLYSDMPDANYRLGRPNEGPFLIPDLSCPSQPVIVVLYKDMRAWKGSNFIVDAKSYMVQYENLHCQPDERAYVLVGIHPVPGLWSNALLSQGPMFKEH